MTVFQIAAKEAFNTPKEIDEIRTFITTEGNVRQEISEEKLKEFSDFIKWYDHEQMRFTQNQGWEKLVNDIAQKDKLIAEQTARIEALSESEEEEYEGFEKVQKDFEWELERSCDYPLYEIEDAIGTVLEITLEQIHAFDIVAKVNTVMNTYRILRYMHEKKQGKK